MTRGKRWLKEKKKELKKKLKEASKNEKIEIVKAHLDNVHDLYSNFINMIPEIEARIEEKKRDLEDVRYSNGILPHDLKAMFEDQIRLWEDVLANLKHVRDRPKAMKLYYSKRVLSKIKQIRKKYPDE